jgi:iron-sulfur cluster repair protein YtfE (RIC family)
VSKGGISLILTAIAATLPARGSRYSGHDDMLRHPSLIPLSRQHHNGLALGVLGRRTLAEDGPQSIGRVAKRVIDYYELELVNHFGMEEQVLFPLCGPLAIVEELVADHRAMEEMIAGLREAPSESLLERFFARLTAHIRREERELFQEMQRTLPQETLERAGEEIERRVVRVCL